MNSRRIYFGLLGLIIILFIGLLAGTYGIDQALTKKATTLTSLKAKNQALAEEQLSLVKAKQDIKKYGDLEKIAQIVVPQDKDQAEAVREIVNLASASNVNLTGITFPNSTLGSSVAGSATGSTTGVSSSAPAAIPSSVSSATSPLNALSQLTPIKNIPGVYELPITLQNDTDHAVTYTAFINFLSALEHNRRTAQVSTIDITPKPNAVNQFVFSLTLNEYIKP